jgi:hypothetical protein
VADRAAREETHLATVDALAVTPEGRRLLSAVLFEYLEHRHVATPVRDQPQAEPRSNGRDESVDAPAAEDRGEPQRPRRRRRRGGGGDRSSR